MPSAASSSRRSSHAQHTLLVQFLLQVLQNNGIQRVAQLRNATIGRTYNKHSSPCVKEATSHQRHAAFACAWNVHAHLHKVRPHAQTQVIAHRDVKHTSARMHTHTHTQTSIIAHLHASTYARPPEHCARGPSCIAAALAKLQKYPIACMQSHVCKRT